MSSPVISNAQTPALKKWYSFDPYHEIITVERKPPAQTQTNRLGVERINNSHDRNQNTPITFSETRSTSSQNPIAPEALKNHSPVAVSCTTLPSLNERDASTKDLIDQVLVARMIGIDLSNPEAMVCTFKFFEAKGYLKPCATSLEGAYLYHKNDVMSFLMNRQKAIDVRNLRDLKFKLLNKKW